MGFDQGFSGISIPGPGRRRSSTKDVLLHFLDNTDVKPVLVTHDGALVLSPKGSILVDKLPVVIPTTVGSLYTNDSGYNRVMTHVSVVNVSGSAVSLQLYIDDSEDTPTDSETWGAPGLDIPAGGVWEWTGRWPLPRDEMLAGVAGAADSLVATIGLEGGINELPWHSLGT
jgi:hypothetical protein